MASFATKGRWGGCGATSSSLVPSADDTGTVGTDVLRWHRVRARFVVSGDYVWDDPACARCEQPFAPGDVAVLQVRLVAPDERGQPLTYAIPVHLRCAG